MTTKLKRGGNKSCESDPSTENGFGEPPYMHLSPDPPMLTITLYYVLIKIVMCVWLCIQSQVLPFSDSTKTIVSLTK